MAFKTFRTIYLNEKLDSRLKEKAEAEHSSASRLVRIAIEEYLNKKDKLNARELLTNSENMNECVGD